MAVDRNWSGRLGNGRLARPLVGHAAQHAQAVSIIDHKKGVVVRAYLTQAFNICKITVHAENTVADDQGLSRCIWYRILQELCQLIVILVTIARHSRATELRSI